jgi:preprotein translocase subunit SecD
VAPPAGTLRVGRYFAALGALLALLYGLVFLPGNEHTPQLGLDLKGGAEVIYQARTLNGHAPKKSQMSEARDIIDRRVNGLGVAQSSVVIQGSDEIVVSVPGKRASDLKDVGRAAVLNFRGLLMPAVLLTPVTASSSNPSATASPTASATTSTTPATTPASSTTPATSTSSSAHGFLARQPLAAATPSATSSATSSASPTATSSATPTATPTATASTSVPARVADPLQGIGFTVPTSETAYNALSSTQKQTLSAALARIDCASTENEPDVATKYFIACDTNSNSTAQLAYLLGPIIVPGHEIAGAGAVAPNPSNGLLQWSVELSLKSTGEANWAKYTSAHNVHNQDTSGANITTCGSSSVACADFVAFTLDGVAISTPINQEAINGGKTQITGGGANGFTQSSATTLANQLKYGALPVSFKQLTSTTVSATLGTTQLKAGFLAGGIGLILVVLYSLIYYRALGLVTIASLLVSGGLTYASLVILGREIGFTLTLAGIAGFIVAVGITADSFVVFFERIKDEVHEGRTVRVGIPRAWVRARRTILSADTVSFLAAAILYYFAAGDVKGFAFTLGMSTILDLVVVFLFTHPIVSLLARSAAFGSARFTGLDAVRVGGVAAPPTPPSPRAARRRVRPAAPAATAPAAGAVAVLDVEIPDVAPEPDVEPPLAEDRLPDQPPSPPEAEADDETGDDLDQPTHSAERRHTTPAPGTAAERAAARRARQRAERGES